MARGPLGDYAQEDPSLGVLHLVVLRSRLGGIEVTAPSVSEAMSRTVLCVVEVRRLQMEGA